MTTIYDHHEIKLAHEIADTHNDKDSITMHLQYARKYQEGFLRKILARAMSIPEHKIKRSRAALYTFLINQSIKNDTGH